VKVPCIFLLVPLWGCWHFGTKYKVSSTANEPTIKMGSSIYVSNDLKPVRFDFICFRTKTAEMGEYTAMYRLCAFGGDTVEIRNGDLFINEEPVDQSFSLMNQYIIAQSEFEKIRDSVDVNNAMQNGGNDSVYVLLNSAFVRRNKINANRIILDKNYPDKDISLVFHHPWNQDHFGPVKVPTGYYFLLGDNRHGAMDSRYLGFISKDKFVATMLRGK
jgi:signal peptidase I